VRGLIAILFAIYSGRCADEILRTDAQGVFRRLGLAEHLTPQRSNGFASMVERIYTVSRRAREARRSEPRIAPTNNDPVSPVLFFEDGVMTFIAEDIAVTSPRSRRGVFA
jgi:hypothetical protein